MTRMVTDRQGREWECSVEDGVIVARSGGRIQIFRDRVGYQELPRKDVLAHIVRTCTPARRIVDEEGAVWLVSSEEHGRQEERRFGIAFDQLNGEARHWHPTTELEDLDNYSDEELVETLKVS